MSRPITQKAKSPLKQTVTMNKTTKSAGEDIVNETIVNKPGEVTGSYKNLMSADAWKKYLANETPEQKAARHAREVRDGKRAPGTSEVVRTVTKGEPVISKESYTPQIKDDYTGITPWENRFNMRTARQSERFSRNEAKRDLRRQANEAARRARRDDGMSMAESLKLRQGIMKGDDKRYSDLYNTSRGLDADQNRAYKTDMQYNQFNKGITRGEEFTGTARNMDIYDASTTKGQGIFKNLQNIDPGFKPEFGSNTSVSKANEGAANVPATNKVNGSGSKGKTLIGARSLNVGSAPQVNVPKVDLVKAGADAKANAAVAEYEKFNPKTSEKPAKAPKAEKQPKEKGGYTRKEVRQMRRENADRAVLDGNEAGSTKAAERRVKRAGRKALNQEARTQRNFDRAANKVVKNAGKMDMSIESPEEDFTFKPIPRKQSPGGAYAAGGKGVESNPMQGINSALSERPKYNSSDGTPTAPRNGSVLSTQAPERPRLSDEQAAEIERAASAVKMRYQSNGGIKQRSPMNKGYFKNK